jgi:3-oxoacyl-[acyl-carrier protein] reductase
MLDTQLRDRVALVTGANHGIGAATARALAAQGCPVLAHYWRLRVERPQGSGMRAAYLESRAQSADAVVAEILEAGGQAAAWECDLSDPASIPTLFDKAEAILGPVEVLVNNAAHWEPSTFSPGGSEQPEPDQWPPSAPALSAEALDRSFAVNSRAVALMMAEFARRHADRGAAWGRIINLSTGGAWCFPNEAAYGASKLALEGLSRTAAVELGPLGITVNIVSPGPTQTRWITPELEASLAAATPLGRVGQPEDIADAVVLLASHQARWVTGQLIHVAGGHGA